MFVSVCLPSKARNSMEDQLKKSILNEYSEKEYSEKEHATHRNFYKTQKAPTFSPLNLSPIKMNTKYSENILLI